MTNKKTWLRKLIAVSLCAAVIGGTGAVYSVSGIDAASAVSDIADAEIKATGIALSATEIAIVKGKTKTVKAILTPDGSTDKVKWTSANPEIATVKGGKITAVSAGTTQVKAYTASGLSAVVDVTVKIYADKLELNKQELKLKKGTSQVLTAIIHPEDCTNKTIKWLTNDSKVATVKEGKVIAVGVGTTTITAKTVNGKTAECTVNVFVEPKKIVLNRTACTLINGKTKALTAIVYPTAAEDTTVIWTSSNNKVASVDNSGLVMAKSSGTATITAKTSNGITSTCEVTVVTKPDSITLDKTSVTMDAGTKVSLKATVNPLSADNKSVTWTSSNSSVASVKSGIVYAKTEGTTTITAKTVNGKTASCIVTVKDYTRQKLRQEAKANNGQIDLRIWTPANEMNFMRTQAEKFKKEYADPSYTINIRIISNSSDESGRKILDLIDTNRKAPDVFLTNTDTIPELVDAGAIAKVSSKNVFKLNDTMSSDAMDSVKYNKAVYAYPRSYDTYYMVYDKRVFNPNDFKTLDTAINKAISKGKNVYFNLTNSYYSSSFLLAAGVEMKYSNGKQTVNFNSAEGLSAVKSMCHYAEYSGKGLVGNPGCMSDNDMIYEGFNDGSISAAVTGPWMINDISNAIGAENVGIVSLPKVLINGEQVQLHSLMSTQAYCVSSESNFPTVAQTFASYMTSSVALKSLAKNVCPDITLKSASSESLTAIAAQQPYSHLLNQTIGGVFWNCGFFDLGATIVADKGTTSDSYLISALEGCQMNIEE